MKDNVFCTIFGYGASARSTPRTSQDLIGKLQEIMREEWYVVYSRRRHPTYSRGSAHCSRGNRQVREKFAKAAEQEVKELARWVLQPQ